MGKIVVLGGAGYMGSALVKELGQLRFHEEVVMVDRHFHPHVVAGLPGNVRFIQADIGDLVAMKEVLHEASAVYLWAAEVEAEASKNKGELVWRENFEKPQALLPLLKGKRLIFASTANLFGGGELPFVGGSPVPHTELVPVAPRFPYAESKASFERLVQAEHQGGFTLLRFGTNYGWAPGIRFNLVVNLFVKRALQGLPLCLFRGGENWRAFCCTIDCARAAVFALEHKECVNEVLHVVSQNMQIKTVAEVVAQQLQNQAGIPEVHIASVDEEADFSSYALDSSKLLALGFAFRWDMARGVDHVAGHLLRMRTKGVLS